MNTDNLVTISKARLEARLSLLRPVKLTALDEALRFSLGLATVTRLMQVNPAVHPLTEERMALGRGLRVLVGALAR